MLQNLKICARVLSLDVVKSHLEISKTSAKHEKTCAKHEKTCAKHEISDIDNSM